MRLETQQRFRKVFWISGKSSQFIFSRATVLLCDRLGLLFEGKALPSRAPAANLPAAWPSQDASGLASVCWSLFFCFSH